MGFRGKPIPNLQNRCLSEGICRWFPLRKGTPKSGRTPGVYAETAPVWGTADQRKTDELLVGLVVRLCRCRHLLALRTTR